MGSKNIRVRTIKIDAFERTIIVEQHNVRELSEIYRALSGPGMKVSVFQPCYPFGNGDVLLVDENGLLRKPAPTAWFEVRGYPQVLVGNGLIVGGGSPNYRGARSSVELIRRLVDFRTLVDWPHKPRLIPAALNENPAN